MAMIKELSYFSGMIKFKLIFIQLGTYDKKGGLTTKRSRRLN